MGGSIFDTLAQQDVQKQQHDQTTSAPAASPAAQPDIFDTLAQNEGNLQKHSQPQGPTISAQPQAADYHPEDVTNDPFQRAGLKIAAPFARKVMDAVDKLREIENFTQEGRQEHPVQAHVGDIANKLEGFLFGNEEHPEAGIGTGKYGMLTNPVLQAVAGAPEAAEAAGGAEAAIKGIGTAKKVAEGGEEAPGLIKQVMQGKKVAQEPAQAGVRKLVGAEEETPMLEGHTSAIDEPIGRVKAEERAAYKAQDEAAGFDVKETRAKLKDAEYKINQPEIDDATRDRLNRTVRELRSEISGAEKRLSDAGIDPKAADRVFQKRKAFEDFRKGLVQHTSPDGESMNVDGLLNYAKKLRNSKYGDRLEQIAGKEGADEFMDTLQQAKELGAHSMRTQEIAKSIGKWALRGGAATVGGTAVYDILH